MKPRPDRPGPGQTSVWDYPRPAIAEPTVKRLQVRLDGQIIADTTRGVRTLETSHPPTYYFPPDDVADDALAAIPGRSLCEWKGQARYYDVIAGETRVPRAAWSYPAPSDTFAILAGFIAFMPAAMEGCFVDGERARPQAGTFYGGWITDDLAGPFKGEPGTMGW